MNLIKNIFRLIFKSILLVFLIILLFISPAYAKEPSKVIYFSAITLYHPIVMYQKYQPLMNYLSANTPYRFELKLSQNYGDIINFLKNNVVQVALLGGVTYLEAKKIFDVNPILKPMGPNGKPFYRCAFIALAANKKINSISDLKNKSIAFASKLSTSGYLAPLYHLYKANVTLDDLSGYKNLRYHDSVAREVLRGEFDAGAVIDSVAARFEIRGLKTIAFSDQIPGLPLVVKGGADPTLVHHIKGALLGLSYDDLESRKIMEKWDEEFKYGFTEAKDSDYDIISKMILYLKGRRVNIP